MRVASGPNGANNASVRRTFDNFRISLDYEHHNGELDENNVAKCAKSSSENVGIGSVWIALRLSNCHCQ
ncbi:hypothetical protein KIN20_012479 [Parelaphostrongylus tenuis]|uniref:Uncharacterized protein n=1 Tax=Parelaphostrongylus tenuis TaxID=148309 RepID=A0AAD5MAR4_PARTN|nr:hypothetical protein KIN20_012479 [Parelaphostrongylus tenuis]